MSREVQQIIQDLVQRKLTRRDFMIKASALGLSAGAIGSLLGACGGGAATPAATETATTAATETSTATATATAAATETVTATATAASGEPKILRVRLYADIQSIDPIGFISSNDYFVAGAVNNGLVTYGPNSYEIVNELVETIEQSEDGKEITFKLKEGIQWHKGYGELTTEDVKYSFERHRDPELNSAYASDWATLDHVEIVDKYNGKIVLKEPFAPMWHSTLPVGSGYVVCKKYVEEVGVEKYATDIIGTGPYIFEEWRPKERIILKKNPDYFGDPPAFDEIQLTPIEDDKAAEVAIEAGEIDWGQISLAAIDRFSSNPQFKIWQKQGPDYTWIGMNIEHPALQDINVRQAIRWGIDVPSIIQAAYFGKNQQAFGLIAPGLVGYWADAPKYQRDVAKAKEYMAKAGVSNLDLRMDLLDTSEYRPYAEIAQQNLAEIGINVQVNPLDSGAFWALGSEEKKTEVALFAIGYAMMPDPMWAAEWFTCDQIDLWNWMRWCSKEYDDLYYKALATVDEKEREQMYIEMQKLWDEACHTVWVAYQTFAYAYVPTIEPATTPHGNYQLKFFKPVSA